MWDYLTNETIQGRYAMGLWFLRECSDLVEIGGDITNAGMFDVSGFQNVYVIGQRSKVYPNSRIHYCLDNIGSINLNELDVAHYGVLLMGMELQGVQDWGQFYDFIRKAFRVVVEFPKSYVVSNNQFELILEKCYKTVAGQITLDFKDNDIVLQNESFLNRTMVVLQ